MCCNGLPACSVGTACWSCPRCNPSITFGTVKRLRIAECIAGDSATRLGVAVAKTRPVLLRLEGQPDVFTTSTLGYTSQTKQYLLQVRSPCGVGCWLSGNWTTAQVLSHGVLRLP